MRHVQAISHLREPGLFNGGIRTANISYDCPAEREWPSPIRANGAVMRRLAPKLEGHDITLTYEEGALILNTTRIPAHATGPRHRPTPPAHATGYERSRRGLPVRDLWLIGSNLTGWSSLK